MMEAKIISRNDKEINLDDLYIYVYMSKDNMRH
jgi:predicted nucleic acid-binding protein